MKVTSISFACFLIVSCSEKEHEASSPLQQLGLRRDPIAGNHERLPVARVNAILGDRGKISDGDSQGEGDTPIPVYLVSGYGLTSEIQDMIFVADTKPKSIILQIEVFDAWFASLIFPEGTDTDWDEVLTDRDDILALFLLHEVGHVVNGDIGRGFSSGGLVRAAPVEGQRIELNADKFAADCLREAQGNSKDFDRMSAAGWVASSLSSLSFELANKTMVENFGSSVLGTPEVYWDKGYSHPNFRLRLLTMMNYIADDDTSQSLLDFFLERRQIAQPDVLWEND